MKNKKKIAIIGHFGGNEDFLDGQTVKTKVLYNELNATGNWNIKKVDTYYKKKHPVKLMLQSIWTVFTKKNVIVLLSGNGMKFYFPMLYVSSKIFGTNVFHDVIGGNLDVYVKNNPSFCKYLNAFKVNWVETNSMKAKLEAVGLKNAEVLPNFKKLESIPASPYEEETFRFCTFSRVMKEKGIETAIQAVKKINSEYGKPMCSLTIYGAVDAGYVDAFEKLSETFGEDVLYGGLVPFSDSVSVLKNYYALLFPTFWTGEGFPGTILDAYASAIPVIASDWNYNRELVKHMNTGIIYPEGNMENLYDSVKWAIVHRGEMNMMRANCEKEYLQYKPENVIKVITEKLK